MWSSSEKDYPLTLYPLRKSSLQHKSMNHSCSLIDFGNLKDQVGDEVYQDIANNSQVGVIMKIASRGLI